jgi:pyrimidine operon attenuation protein/uracil phosphoribosyltransferase
MELGTRLSRSSSSAICHQGKVIMEKTEQRVVMESAAIHETLARLAREIMEQVADRKKLLLIGIHTGGVHLAKRLQHMIAANHQLSPPVGMLDITLYRDDWTRLHTQPVVRATDLPFRIDDQEVVLVDDVLFTGRTIRAALDALIDYGRPRRVQVAVLVDRGHRELPICGQFIGTNLETLPAEHVYVHLVETDGIDRVVVQQPLPGNSDQ